MLVKETDSLIVWKKYFLLFCIALIWSAPLSFLMDCHAPVLWDPLTHFINQSNIAFGDRFCGLPYAWLSDLLGAMWLKLCIDHQYLYWWFNFGGVVIVALNSTLWLNIIFRTFGLSHSYLLPIGIVSALTLTPVFYLMIGYGTLPLLFSGIAISFLLNLVSEHDQRKIFYGVIVAGVLFALLESARINLLPLGIIPIFWLTVKYFKRKKYLFLLCAEYLIIYLITLLVLRMILNHLIGPNANRIPATDIVKVVVKYCGVMIPCLLRSVLFGAVYFIVLLFLKKCDNALVKKSYWLLPVLSAVIYVLFRNYYICPKISATAACSTECVTAGLVIKDYYYYVYVMLPLFVCALFLIATHIVTEYVSHKAVANKDIAIILMTITICFEFFCYTFGSNVVYLTTHLWNNIFVCFFAVALCRYFADGKYKMMRVGVLASLLVINVLLSIDASCGFNFLHEKWYAVQTGCCRGLFTHNQARGLEYDETAQMVKPYMKPDDIVFEYIPDEYSKWLPVTVALGGRFSFAFWSDIPSRENIKVIQHVLIWHPNSKMYRNDERHYGFFDIYNFGKRVVEEENLSLIIETDKFSFYSRKPSPTAENGADL